METMSLGRRAARPFSRFGTYCAEFFLEVWALHRERRALQSLDDAALKDIGITRADVDGEVGKPFWRR